MKTLEIHLLPLSPLLMGGWSAPRQGGDKASARDGAGRPVVPASALRGALRLTLERLLRGRDGDDAACSANLPPEAGAAACRCPVCRLFGRQEGGTGALRLADAELAAGVDLPAGGALRPAVGVSRRRGAAVDRHLALFEPAELPAGVRLVARAWLVGAGAAEAEDLLHLRAACAALSGLGGGKARGLGWVECELVETEAPVPVPWPGGAEVPAGDLTVRFMARSPLHVGDGRPLGFFHRTLTHVPGSAVRGALAFALLEQELAGPEDEIFRRLVDPAGGVSFGSARLAGDVPSALRRRCRPGEHVFDGLVGEIVRRRAAAAGLALASAAGPCPHPGCGAAKAVPWDWRAGHLPPAVVARGRAAQNRRTGTALDGKLFSLQVVEPPAGDPVWAATVRGLDRETAGLLARLAGREVWLGAKRSQGLGRSLVELAAAPEPDAARAFTACEALGAVLEEAWEALAAAVGRPLPPLLPAGRLPLAAVLAEPWCPDESEPLAGGPLGGELGAPLAAFLSLAEEGRFGAVEADRHAAPAGVLRGEEPPVVAATAGSTWIYAVAPERLRAGLPGWLARGGSGRRREIGWGRLLVRGPGDDF